jgi:hypothetical protein
MSKSIYVAGPMRGYPNFNFEAFDAASAELRAQGWQVFSPAEHDRLTGFDPSIADMDAQHFDVTKAFRWDIVTLLHVDAVYFLRGWEASQGANTEHTVAVSLGLQRIYEDPRDEQEYYYLPHIAFRRSAIQ